MSFREIQKLMKYEYESIDSQNEAQARLENPNLVTFMPEKYIMDDVIADRTPNSSRFFGTNLTK